jgi:aspartyl-tRNA(Asn)/glutamyl-tRNA(Gln) amidotransferase subunit A
MAAVDRDSGALDSGNPLQGIRIGIPQVSRGISIATCLTMFQEYFPVELDPFITSRFRSTLDALAEAGAELCSVSLPSTPYALSAYYVISSAEASSNLARFDGVQFGEYTAPEESFRGIIGDLYALNRSKHFGPEIKRRILLGTYALTAA